MKAAKRTPKLSLAAQYEAEARRLAGCATRMERHFLSVSLAKGKELKPIGRMADSKA